jgi:flagellar motor component MotA
MSARMVYMPAAAKLRQAVEKRRFRNQLIPEGMVMLVSDKTPMYIQDRLNSFLRPELHDYFDYFNKESNVKPMPHKQAQKSAHLKAIHELQALQA